MGAVWSVGAATLTAIEEIVALTAVGAIITIAVYWDSITSWFWATFICDPGRLQ